MVKISVIIPVYGVEKYIDRCLKSIVNQTLKEIEIIIVNDETKDNSMTICEEYKKRDNRIKIFNKKNEGLGLTRNFGIERASGEYIAFVDSDDYIDLNFYEELYRNAKKNNADACFTNYKIVTQKYNMIINDIPFNKEVLEAKTVLYNMMKVPQQNYTNKFIGMSVWRAIYKRDIIENNDIRFYSERKYISEDILFNFDFLEKANKISFINNVYYYYCKNEDSLTNTYREDRFEKCIILYLKLIERSKENNEYNKMKTGIANGLIDNVRVCIKHTFIYNNYSKARDIIKKYLINENVQKALKEKSDETFRKSIFDWAMKKGNIFLLYVFCRIRRNMKK